MSYGHFKPAPTKDVVRRRERESLVQWALQNSGMREAFHELKLQHCKFVNDACLRRCLYWAEKSMHLMPRLREAYLTGT